jgi:hypothetical protein
MKPKSARDARAATAFFKPPIKKWSKGIASVQ